MQRTPTWLNVPSDFDGAQLVTSGSKPGKKMTDRQTDTGRHAQIQAHNEQQRRNTIMYSFQSSM